MAVCNCCYLAVCIIDLSLVYFCCFAVCIVFGLPCVLMLASRVYFRWLAVCIVAGRSWVFLLVGCVYCCCLDSTLLFVGLLNFAGWLCVLL